MIIPAGYAQANLLFTGGGAPRGAQVVIGVKVTAGVTDPLVIATGVYQSWATHILPVQSSGIVLSGCKAKMGPNETGLDATYALLTGGGNIASTVPPQVAVLVTKHTAFGGRKGRGRMFVPGVVEGDIDAGGNLGAAQVADWQARMTAFRTAIIGLSSVDDLVLLHSGEGEVPTPITSLNVSSKVATQRRRLRKVGGRRKAVPA